ILHVTPRRALLPVAILGRPADRRGRRSRAGGGRRGRRRGRGGVTRAPAREIHPRIHVAFEPFLGQGVGGDVLLEAEIESRTALERTLHVALARPLVVLLDIAVRARIAVGAVPLEVLEVALEAPPALPV